ncbi:MAG: TRAP transporter substrate-binding protein DctP [Burkholderiaceae bacterium]
MSRFNGELRRRTVLKGTLAIAASPAIIRSAAAQPTIRWKLQAYYPKASASFKDSLGVLASEIQARTDGRLELELFGVGELATGPEIFNMVRRGVIPMATTYPGYNLGEADLMGMYAGVPGTLREPWEMMHLTKNLGLEEALNEELRPKGVFMMADKALTQEVVLKERIQPGDDLAAVKVRSTGAMLEFLDAAGFAPVHIAAPEIYQSLATGVIDGANWGGPVGILSARLWEVAKVYMRPTALISNDCYVINIAAWEQLPADVQTIFRSLLEERHFQRSIEYQHQNAVALRTGLEKLGVEVQRFPDDIMAKFAESSRAILAKEMAKGPKAKEIGEKLAGLMKDLGYA